MSNKLTLQQQQAVNELGKQFSDATIQLHEAIARQAGLTGTDHKYLALLLQHGPMTAGELARHTGLTTGAVTGLIDRLERKNLVKRQAGTDDRRTITIAPDKDRADELLGAAYAELQTTITNLMATFPDHEIEVIERYLRATIDIMTQLTTDLKNR